MLANSYLYLKQAKIVCSSILLLKKQSQLKKSSVFLNHLTKNRQLDKMLGKNNSYTLKVTFVFSSKFKHMQ